jgi:predicted nucleic acid-binding protein
MKAIELFGSLVNIHPRYGNNFIDANTFDRRDPAHDAAVQTILALAEAGKFTLLLAYSVKAEIEHPNTPPEIKRQAARLIYSIEVSLTASERATHARIAALIQGNAQPGKHARDAFHLVESAKNGGRHFITEDKRLLRLAPAIWKELLIQVLTPQEFVTDYDFSGER